MLNLEWRAIHNWPGCNSEGGCRVRRVLEAERDFRDQKGRLQEVEALGHRVLFHPNFHCELSFIELYWCQAKRFAREIFGHNFEALKAEELALVSKASFRGFYRLALREIDAYSAGVQYGTVEFFKECI